MTRQVRRDALRRLALQPLGFLRAFERLVVNVAFNAMADQTPELRRRDGVHLDAVALEILGVAVVLGLRGPRGQVPPPDLLGRTATRSK
jgi:hypothetical protein